MKAIIKDIIIVVVLVGMIMFFVKPIIVKQTSMLPTLVENDYLFLSRQAYTFGNPERGDIVVFPHIEGGEKDLYIKRVIALPGDILDIHDGKVFIDGKEQNDSYTKDGYTEGEVEALEIPDGKLFVMGDNREVSIDSRDPSVGLVNIDDITGVAFFRLFPFKKIGTIK